MWDPGLTRRFTPSDVLRMTEWERPNTDTVT